MKEKWHGTLNGYGYHQCRCDDCRLAQSQYNRRIRNERLAGLRKIPGKCGTAGKYSHGCRCDDCRMAHNDLAREQTLIRSLNRGGGVPLKTGRPRLDKQLIISVKEKLMLEQDGKCAICDTEDKLLVVDHDHITMAIRGLLCSNCNTGLGKLGDSVEGLNRALKYLRNT